MSILDKSNPIYLTNGCCEPTGHVTAADLDALGLGYQAEHEVIGGFYPLTAEEEKYIAETTIQVAPGIEALAGYSTIYQGEKWLMPVAEVGFHNLEADPDNDLDLEDMPTVKARIDELIEPLRARVETVGGYVIYDGEPCGPVPGGDRFEILILLPVELALKIKADSFQGWSDYLEESLFVLDNPNENCLEDMSCPRCGSYGPFDIDATSYTHTVYDDGTEARDADVEWDAWSLCRCRECLSLATISEFQGKERVLSPEERLRGFVETIANMSIWDQDNDEGEPYREIEEPCEGHQDSHEALMNAIEQARGLLKQVG